MKRIGLLVAATMIAFGCAPVNMVTDRYTQGQPFEYKNGFKDGCGSGYVAAGHPYAAFKKDVNRFSYDKIYAQGWNDGMAVCKGSYESTSRSVR